MVYLGLWFQRARGSSWRLRAHVLSHTQEAERERTGKDTFTPKAYSQQSLLQQGCAIQPPHQSSITKWVQVPETMRALVVKPSQNPQLGSVQSR